MRLCAEQKEGPASRFSRSCCSCSARSVYSLCLACSVRRALSSRRRVRGVACSVRRVALRFVSLLASSSSALWACSRPPRLPFGPARAMASSHSCPGLVSLVPWPRLARALASRRSCTGLASLMRWPRITRAWSRPARALSSRQPCAGLALLVCWASVARVLASRRSCRTSRASRVFPVIGVIDSAQWACHKGLSSPRSHRLSPVGGVCG
jgi:hypothetical protein